MSVTQANPSHYTRPNTDDLPRLPKPQEVTGVVMNTISTDGVEIAPFKDHKTILLFSGTGKAKIKAGNTFASRDDLTVQGTTAGVFVAIESAKFMDKETGKILIQLEGSTALSVAVLETR